jgi:uncharacterized membrane protein YcaP (DUF421 family)
MMLSQIINDLFVPGSPIAEKAIRTVVVYGFLIVLLRIAGKRTLAQLTSFDLVVLLLLSNTVQNAIIGTDNSLVGGLVGAAILVIINWVVAYLLYKHRRADHAVEGGAALLMEHGKYIEANMKQQLITHAELNRAARKEGISGMSDVRAARLEAGGVFTFELEEPTAHDKHLSDLISRLERIEDILQRLDKSGDSQTTDA